MEFHRDTDLGVQLQSVRSGWACHRPVLTACSVGQAWYHTRHLGRVNGRAAGEPLERPRWAFDEVAAWDEAEQGRNGGARDEFARPD